MGLRSQIQIFSALNTCPLCYGISICHGVSLISIVNDIVLFLEKGLIVISSSFKLQLLLSSKVSLLLNVTLHS